MVVLLVQLLPRVQVSASLVQGLVQHDEGKPLVVQLVDERLAIQLVAPVGAGGGDVVHHLLLAQHHDTRHVRE